MRYGTFESSLRDSIPTCYCQLLTDLKKLTEWADGVRLLLIMRCIEKTD